MYHLLDPELLAGAIAGAVIVSAFSAPRLRRGVLAAVSVLVVAIMLTEGAPGLIALTATFLDRSFYGLGDFWLGAAVGAASVLAMSGGTDADRS